MSPATARAQSRATVAQPPASSRFARDEAVDFFRGIGLWMIFIDHLDPNIWSHLSLWRFGFSDFAEVFVFLSGFINVGSWERAVSSGDVSVVGTKLAKRVARLYLAHVLSLSFSLATIALAASYHLRTNDPSLYAWMHHPVRYFVGIFTLTNAPQYFSLLPFYLLLAPALPLVILGLKRAPIATLVLSGTLWAISQTPWAQALVKNDTWYFQPLAWQFLLVLGAAVRYFSKRLSSISRSPWVIAAAAGIAGASVVLKSLTLFPWTLHLLNPHLHAILMRDSGKAELAPYRLIHFLALVVLTRHRVLAPRLASLVHSASRHRLWSRLAVYLRVHVDP